MEGKKIEIEIKIQKGHSDKKDEVEGTIEEKLREKLSTEPTDFFTANDKVTINIVTKEEKG
jgi:hypothetical protein